MLFLLFILTAINYLDRTNMAVAASSMSDELGFSAATMGLLFSAFSWSYGLMQIPGGWFIERFGSRIVYTASLFLWSLFTMFMGLGKSFASLFGIRMAIGAAEAPAFPTNSRVVAAWFPSHERATATSIYTAGEFIGLAFLTPVLFWILEPTVGGKFSISPALSASSPASFGSFSTVNPVPNLVPTKPNWTTSAKEAA